MFSRNSSQSSTRTMRSCTSRVTRLAVLTARWLMENSYGFKTAAVHSRDTTLATCTALLLHVPVCRPSRMRLTSALKQEAGTGTLIPFPSCTSLEHGGSRILARRRWLTSRRPSYRHPLTRWSLKTTMLGATMPAGRRRLTLEPPFTRNLNISNLNMKN
ncbi:hypothetical protein BV20DRAFT_515835 [Pilatotrama ljubarskyi]|nr:hypothetical protein BV20DRAFT_515835 [Pilatotrama ljubarskyi]